MQHRIVQKYEFEISLKSKAKPVEIIIYDEDVAHSFFRKCFSKKTIEWKEQAIVVALDSKGGVIGWYKVADGGLNTLLIDPKVVFQFLLLSNATRFFIVHNHPSGNTNPSRSDIEFTKNLKQAGKIFGIQLIASYIITKDELKAI